MPDYCKGRSFEDIIGKYENLVQDDDSEIEYESSNDSKSNIWENIFRIVKVNVQFEISNFGYTLHPISNKLKFPINLCEDQLSSFSRGILFYQEHTQTFDELYKMKNKEK